MSRALAWQFAIFTIAFVAMTYELIEWVYAATAGGESGANFLGTLGAVASSLLFLAVRRDEPV